MKTEEKQRFWQGHINDWRKSQVTQKVYCEERDLSFAQFAYWRTRLNRASANPGKLVPVRVASSAPTGTATLYLPAGVRMEIPASSLADVLPVVYRAVRDSV